MADLSSADLVAQQPLARHNLAPTNITAAGGTLLATCILYNFPPELRRVIFQFAVLWFFEEHPERRDILYKFGWTQNQRVIDEGITRHVGGLKAQDVPWLETVLWPDAKLYEECITIRIELSSLTLQPGVTACDFPYGENAIAWASDIDIDPKIRNIIREVTYMLEMDDESDRRKFSMEDSFDMGDDAYGADGDPTAYVEKMMGTDYWFRMTALGKTIKKLVIDTESSVATTVRLHLPQLKKIVMRFPETHKGRRERCKMYSQQRRELWVRLRKSFSYSCVESFELQQVRFWNGKKWKPEQQEQPELTILETPYFFQFTTDLNKIFGFNCDARLQLKRDRIDAVFKIKNNCYYEVKETWTANEDAWLVWNPRAERALAKDEDSDEEESEDGRESEEETEESDEESEAYSEEDRMSDGEPQ